MPFKTQLDPNYPDSQYRSTPQRHRPDRLKLVPATIADTKDISSENAGRKQQAFLPFSLLRNPERREPPLPRNPMTINP
jgi:hypothetical protein